MIRMCAYVESQRSILPPSIGRYRIARIAREGKRNAKRRDIYRESL